MFSVILKWKTSHLNDTLPLTSLFHEVLIMRYQRDDVVNNADVNGGHEVNIAGVNKINGFWTRALKKRSRSGLAFFFHHLLL